MAAPTVIKSTDSGAPVCNGVIGQAIVLLDYVLVTRLGWAKVFSGTNKAVYYPQQKGSENRLYYRVDDNYGGLAYKLSVYETMTDIDTGVLVRDYMWVTKSNTATTTVRPWVAIGDAFGVYFRSEYTPTYWRLNYMGLCTSLFAFDNWFSVITGHYYTGGSPSGEPASSFAAPLNNDRITWRGSSGDVGITTPSFWALLGANYSGVDFSSNYNYPWNGSLVCSQPILTDFGVRGTFPGFYAPHHSGGFTDLQEISADGKTYIVLFDGGSGISKILIDISEGFRP